MGPAKSWQGRWDQGIERLLGWDPGERWYKLLQPSGAKVIPPAPAPLTHRARWARAHLFGVGAPVRIFPNVHI